MMRVFEQIRDNAARTPPQRERHVDLVRAVSITLVVVGHWLVISISHDNDLDGVNALAEIGWFHPLTWLFQVIPLFFFVGGYSNAASLAAHRRHGGDAWSWIAQRFDRVVRPTSALLALLVAGVVAALIVGVSSEDVSAAMWLGTVPLWFVLAYLAVSALVPVMWRVHRRMGWWAPASLLGVIAVADLVGLGAGGEAVRQVNYLVVFLAFHQLGIMWRDGGLTASIPTGLTIAAVAAVAAIGLVVVGPYPVSMVDVPSDELQNASPPTLAFLAVGIAQVGIVLAVRDPVDRWLHRPLPWKVVVAVNAVILTVFLWHMAAAVLAALVLHVLVPLPTAPIGTVEWFVLRLPWMATCLVALAVLVAPMSSVERAAVGTDPGRIERRSVRFGLVVSSAAVLTGMLGIAAAGPEDPARVGVPAWSLGIFAAGAVVLVAVGRASAGRIGTRHDEDGPGRTRRRHRA